MTAIRSDERGFAPVAGSGMLVSIVVVLLALIGAAVVGMIDGVAPPDAEFQVENEGTELVIVAAGPEPVAAEELYVRGEDPNEEVQFGAWPDDGVVRPGDRVTIPNATGNENVEIIWEPVAFDTYEKLGSYSGEGSAIEANPERDPLGATGV